MLIKEELLMNCGAKIVNFTKGKYVFKENDDVISYFQISTGTVKIVSEKKAGREFIHNISIQGDCLGALFLFLKHPYSVSAIAMENSRIIKLEKLGFDLMLKDNPKILLDLYKYTAENMHYTYLMKGFASESPSEKIMNLFNYLKKSKPPTDSFQVFLTRHQIASLTGLRVETVIRTIKKLQNQGIRLVINSKIFY
ncbi:Crp/Fnr family transcriptional regulator [Chryseobacterium sp. 2987]|uniref:Crp/Fnr family transcriptional regulator n=1 Tax=Chryseobacterium sp. 2987 TaxID=2817767 RepID=UPI0028617C59|nr:Crp/Fnr family transcriptional regulator [Chryseobacterium sp. 2987]MDR6919258.1 CRP-like cAMP-binding protein [Chryseobacterium sp. 2987]